MDLIDRCKKLFDNAANGASNVPTWLEMPAERSDQPAMLGPVLCKDAHYFQVQVDEMFLATSRHWWVQHMPLVFAHSEFIYDNGLLAVPYIVGPGLIEKLGQQVPAGMVFSRTRVAGVHPYCGGQIALTMILYRAQHEDWARRMLGVLETTARAFDFSTAVSAYSKVADALLGGVEALLGLHNLVPVAGYRIDLSPQPGLGLAPRYFALIDAQDGTLDTSRLRVVGDRLFDDKGPYRSADFVLYSLRGLAEREDESMLAFQPLWERVRHEAAIPTDDGYQSAKSNMVALYQAMLQDPDLTYAHGKAMAARYAQRMKEIHDTAMCSASLGPSRAVDPVRELSLAVLSL